MFNWLCNIIIQAEHMTQRLHQQLAPPGANCLTCGTRAVLSTLYPGICSRCVEQIPWIRSIRCLRCGRGVGCPDCARTHMQNRSYICNRSAVQYNGLMKEWIGMYKFRGHERYAPLLTALLIRAFQAMIEEMNATLAKETQALVAHSATPAHKSVDGFVHPPHLHVSASAYACLPVPSASLHALDAHTTVDAHDSSTQPMGNHTPACARFHSRAATHRPASLSGPKKPQWRPDAITYVPVSGERLAERGFNQAERLAAGLATAFRLPIVDLLQRQINTTKQRFKSRSERIETMKNAFSIQSDSLYIIEELYRGIKPIQLLLIDDIYTTGSTLDACGQVILEAAHSISISVEIYTLTLARS